MKKRIVLSVIALVCMMYFTASFADNCTESKALLDHALQQPPNELTEEYVATALQGCAEKAEIVARVAAYYEQWYKDELNPEKQAEYKKLARHYYQEAKQQGKGRQSKTAETRLAQLDDGREFNEVTFRALRPSSAGQTGSGLDLKVHFEVNSCELSNAVQKHLDALGKVMAESDSITVSLEGHTDMRGDETYNENLSVKRAERVKDYLVGTYAIDPQRIKTTGYGFSRLADPADPYGEKNRRVEVIKLTE